MKKLPHWLWALGGIIAFIAACFLYIGVLQLTGNFHPVVPRELYRSGQVSAADIAYYKQQYHLKTIINLRGPNSNSKWYQEEIAATAANDIRHIDFKMSARRGMTEDEAQALIIVMRDAPKPILLHCASGADRAGLASALYLAGVKKDTEFNAELQMSLYYGHVALWFIPAYGVNRTFENLEPSLGYFDS